MRTLRLRVRPRFAKLTADSRSGETGSRAPQGYFAIRKGPLDRNGGVQTLGEGLCGVVAKVEWHPGVLYPRVGFIATNLSRPAERVVAFYNGRGTAEQWIKEDKNATKWTRLSCCSFAANAVRLQLHALAYNLANFLRTLALSEAVKQWSLTSLRGKLVKIGAKLVVYGGYMTFQMAEVAVSRDLFRRILQMIDGLRPGRTARC